jgi:hypothetical protein
MPGIKLQNHTALQSRLSLLLPFLSFPFLPSLLSPLYHYLVYSLPLSPWPFFRQLALLPLFRLNLSHPSPNTTTPHSRRTTISPLRQTQPLYNRLPRRQRPLRQTPSPSPSLPDLRQRFLAAHRRTQCIIPAQTLPRKKLWVEWVRGCGFAGCRGRGTETCERDLSRCGYCVKCWCWSGVIVSGGVGVDYSVFLVVVVGCGVIGVVD